ncbi:lysyl oxidase family protein [Natrinema ejinorense]|uniref:Lysyl oxidase n=1 Tax=Natrinema ejinorense TaxID=373386 RepID=A0A2A5QPI8_9EURY|nr:lysyl oxidase family protein [Natrinema ejinorense]PCR88734.1 hypothetical protein CP557_19745 [Natrinema ejinorense]
MKIQWTNGRKRVALLGGVLLVAVAGIGMISLAGIVVDNPFAVSVSDSSTEAPAPSGSDGTVNEGDTPTDEGNSATSPPTLEPGPEPADDHVAAKPGVNFVPGVRNFNISIESFDESSPDVEDGFVTPGEHRLLRFDMIIYNVGDTDAELGNPLDRHDLYEYSDSHGHAHLKGFNKYTLFDESGKKMDVGKKQTFCLRDNFRISSRSNASSSPQFDCDYQGISAGWADIYDSSLPGQYLVIDSLSDGKYTLRATTNAEGTVDEACTGDNTVRVDLRIHNGTVTETDTSQNRSVRASAC